MSKAASSAATAATLPSRKPVNKVGYGFAPVPIGFASEVMPYVSRIAGWMVIYILEQQYGYGDWNPSEPPKPVEISTDEIMKSWNCSRRTAIEARMEAQELELVKIAPGRKRSDVYLGVRRESFRSVRQRVADRVRIAAAKAAEIGVIKKPAAKALVASCAVDFACPVPSQKGVCPVKAAGVRADGKVSNRNSAAGFVDLSRLIGEQVQKNSTFAMCSPNGGTERPYAISGPGLPQGDGAGVAPGASSSCVAGDFSAGERAEELYCFLVAEVQPLIGAPLLPEMYSAIRAAMGGTRVYYLQQRFKRRWKAVGSWAFVRDHLALDARLAWEQTTQFQRLDRQRQRAEERPPPQCARCGDTGYRCKGNGPRSGDEMRAAVAAGLLEEICGCGQGDFWVGMVPEVKEFRIRGQPQGAA